jgi:hypothetical protein
MQPAPVVEQLCSMESSPFDDEGQGARRQIAAQDADRLDSNSSFRAAVESMKMGRLVIEKVHADHYAEEA